MSNTTKLWINDKLELRHSPTGWPSDVGCDDMEDTIQYEKYLANAKADSILLLPPNDGRIVVGDRKLIPDTFIEIEGEMEVGYQWKNTNPGGHGWINVSEKECLRFKEAGYDTRQVARLKPVEKYVDPERESFEKGLSKLYDKSGQVYGGARGADVPEGVDAGLKDRILAAFRDAWRKSGFAPPDRILEAVLDELKIK